MKQTLTGKVVSSKTSHTVVVLIEVTKVHPKYSKRYTVQQRVMAHVDSDIKIPVGSQVTIVSCRPLSKLKRWKIVENV